MPAELFRFANGKARINLDLIFPPFLEAALEVLAACKGQGAHYYVVADTVRDDGGGYRTFAAQDWLYAQGRTRDGRRVTNARGGDSAHNYGLALDLCRDAHVTRVGLQPSWANGDYDTLGRVAKAHGLKWGGDFGDAPHIQVPGYVTAAQLAPLKAAHAAGGLEGAWSAIG